MRNIKFRGLSLSGKWVYGSLILSESLTHGTQAQIYDGNGFHVCLAYSICQFIGQTDYYGNDMYEKDIISWYEEEENQPLAWIEWDQNRFGFYVNSNSCWAGSIDEFIFPKVVGNLIQNGDLIKNKNDIK